MRKTIFWDPKKFPFLTELATASARGNFNRFLCESAETELRRLTKTEPVDELQEIREGIREIQTTLAALAKNGVITKQAEQAVLESVKTRLAIKKLVC